MTTSLSLLDQPEKCAALDPCGMRELIESFPGQFEAAADIALSLSLPIEKKPENLIIAGLGGSAIGGDLVRSILGDSLRIPLIVNRDYRLPGFAGLESIVIASSYSGNTEETLSAYSQALKVGARIVCITSGGRLAELARADQKPLVLIPGGMPPRAAIGYSVMALLGTLRAMGLIQDLGQPAKETVGLISKLAQRYQSDVPTVRNPAKALAQSLFGRIVAVYGGIGLLDSVAARWRGQMEENAKNLALHHVLPEMNHNEILGWECPKEALKQIAVVFLRDRDDHPQVHRRFDLTKQIIGDECGATHEVWSEGNSSLARVFSVLYLGDFVSLYLAFLNGVDPTRIDAIDFLKRELSS